MNLVGKIFVVLILVMSLVFMSFSVVVYATHQNWKKVATRPESEVGPDKPLGLIHLVKNLEARIQELRDQKTTLEGELAAERKARDQAIAKCDTQHAQLKDEYDELDTAYARVVGERRDAQSAQNSMQIVLGDLRAEIDGLRRNTGEAETDRDAHFKQVVKATDEVHQLIDERDRLKKQLEDILRRYHDAITVLRINGLPLKVPPEKPPIADGLVLAVPEPDLCEISLGSDDGLRKGHKLEVYRKSGGSSSYVGRIYVRKTAFDKSVCWIDPGYVKSPVRQTDLVTTRIDVFPIPGSK